MKSHVKHYEKSLYPFQDAVLKRINDLKTPFYLSGGTALARCYFNQRYSDDLEFYVDANYERWIEIVFKAFENSGAGGDFSLASAKTIRRENDAQILLQNGADIELVLTFRKNKAPHFGGFTNHPRLGRVDSWQNILSNALVAMQRMDIRDFADVWIIAKNSPFEWSEIVAEAGQKDAAMESALIAALLKNIPIESIDLVNWIYSFDREQFLNDIDRMAGNAQNGETNSIFSVGWIC